MPTPIADAVLIGITALGLNAGPGMPSYAAARGAIYLSTDFGMYVNADGGMGWVRK